VGDRSVFVAVVNDETVSEFVPRFGTGADHKVLGMRLPYAAIGVNVMDIDDKVAVSPVLMVFARVSRTLKRKFPALDASHTEMLVTISPFVPAQFDQDGSVAVMALDPADATDQVIAGRVVTDDTFDVPAAPGSPVCNCTNVVAGAVNAVPASMSSHLLARVVAARPLAIAIVLRRGHGQVCGDGEDADDNGRRRRRHFIAHQVSAFLKPVDQF
jgi:hypothetical protein